MANSIDICKYKFFDLLCKDPKINEIWLYGSRARGDSNPRSDIDLAISCPNCSKTDWANILDIIENADTLLKIDCVRLEDLNDSEQLYKNIINNHKVLYPKS